MDLRAIERICGAFRTRLKVLQLESGLARLVLLGLAMLPAFLVIDWWIHLSTIWRLLGLLVYAAAIASTSWFTLLKPLTRSWSNEEVLRYMDAVQPRGRGMLLDLYELVQENGIQELSSSTGRDLAQSATTDLTGMLQQIQPAAAFQPGRARRWLAGSLILGVMFGIACATIGTYVGIGCRRFFNPFSSAQWPHRTDIEIVQPKNGWTIPQMETLTLEARISGLVPPHVIVAYRSETGGRWIKEKVDVKQGAITFDFKEVREPLKFYLSGGDYETDLQSISIVERPYLKGIVARYEVPSYAGIPNREEPTGQLRGLEGTKVTLSFKASIPISRALFILDQEAPEELPLSSSTTFAKQLILRKNGSYVIRLFDRNGFREPSGKPERYEIRVTPDEPPVVELLSPSSDVTLTRGATLKVAFKAADDFGLKKVGVQYQIDDGPLTPLSDRITGPIPQTGVQSKGDFRWDLRRLEHLPEQGTIHCIITAEDVNPTGRGVDKKHFQIHLVKVSEFHRKLVTDAQEMMREALNAYNRQWDAWQKGLQLVGGGSGKLDDPAWKDMVESQLGAEQSAKRMAGLLLELTAAYETNHLERELMSGRLKRIAEWLKKVTGAADSELSKISDALRKARPGSSADEVSERLKSLRGTAVGGIKDSQKLAVLYLERIISKSYDWRDLQRATIDTTLLAEDQVEVKTEVEKIAPRFVLKEKQDLSDADQTELEKLGSRQRGLCDSEAKMEASLSEMIYAAKKQQRRNILPHLEAPYSLLRSNRTKEMLDEAAKKIANNQPFAIKDELKKAMDILGAVKAGLLIAGEKVGDADEQIALNTPLTSKKDFEAVKEAAETKPPDPGSAQDAGIASPDPRDLLKILPPGQDKLSILISQTGETARSAVSRTAYLSQARPAAEMPRCMKLNHARVREMQRGVSEALQLALAEAYNPAIPAFLKEELAGDAESLKAIDSLLGAKDLSELTRQLQDDFIRNLDDLIQYIAFQKKVDEATAQNKKGGGEDEHRQKFLLRDKDLAAVEGAVRELKGISILQKDVHRSVGRFSRITAQGPLQTGIEKVNRERASLGQKQVAERMVSSVTARTAHLRAEAAPRVKESGLDALSGLDLSPLSAQVAAGRQDAELARRLDETVKTMEGSLQTLLDVLEERVKVPVIKAPLIVETITQSDYEKNNAPESLAERVRLDPALPPEIKEKMLQALSKGFPPKYKDLLAAYYSSCLQTGPKP